VSEQAITDRALARLMPVHRPVFERLRIKQQALLAELQDEQRNAPARMVYHTAKSRGMIGITSSRSLWMSDYMEMNDKKEIRWGVDIGIAELRSEYRKRPKSEPLTRFVERTAEIIEKDGLGVYFSAYILSLSLKKDDLYQWTNYGDRARGYCLGFDGGVLDAAFVQFTHSLDQIGYGSFSVLYSRAGLRRRMRQYARNVLDAISELENAPELARSLTKTLEEIGKELIYAFIYTAVYYKNPDFKTEQEYRYLVMTSAGNRLPILKQRPLRGKEIDYFEFDWRSHSHALRSIMIGPDKNEVKGRRAIARALAGTGLAPAVRKSGIPYRN
jgi:Protein of unknown function (DUF2971)